MPIWAVWIHRSRQLSLPSLPFKAQSYASANLVIVLSFFIHKLFACLLKRPSGKHVSQALDLQLCEILLLLLNGFWHSRNLFLLISTLSSSRWGRAQRFTSNPQKSSLQSIIVSRTTCPPLVVTIKVWRCSVVSCLTIPIPNSPIVWRSHTSDLD